MWVCTLSQGHLLLTIVLAFFINSTSSLEQGIVAHYTFNNCDARDVSGNDAHGQLFGGIACWCGIEDDGLLLDGIDDYVVFMGKVNDHFTTSDFTISFYFKPEKHNVFQQSLLSKRTDCTENNMFDLLLNLNSNIVNAQVYETPNKYHGKISPNLLSAGWHHFALVREGLRATTYINGQLQKENHRCSGLDLTNKTPLSFSNSPCVDDGYARRFQGILDELRVYNRALSRKEIQELYSKYPVENAKMDCVS